MLLKGQDGSEFELKIVGYEFPKSREKFDANWLIISGKLRSTTDNWEFCSPCIFTWDTEQWCNWFTKLGKQQLFSEEESFLVTYEIKLHLEVLKQEADTILLRLINEVRYDSVLKQWVKHVYDMPLSAANMAAAALEWCEEIKRFPTRTPFRR